MHTSPIIPIIMYLARGQVAFFKCVESNLDLAGAYLFSIAWVSLLHSFSYFTYWMNMRC